MRTIPNQPINFSGSLLAGCICDPLVPPLLYSPDDDDLRFQIGADLCPNEPGLLDASNFQSTDWKAGLAWTLFPGQACGTSIALATLEDTAFVPTVGTDYVLRFIVTSITGSMTYALGGVSGVITSPGTYNITITAVSVGGLVFTLDTAETSVCLSFADVYEANRDFEVEVLDASGAVVDSFTPVSDPSYFVFDDDIMIVTIPAGGITEEGCFTLRVTNDCDDLSAAVTSQVIKPLTSTDCTLAITACNDSSALGFAPYPFTIRLDAKLTHPTWEYDVSEEKRSNGRIMRNYIDSQRKMELRIGLQSEYIHPFLATLPLFAHVYIGQQEFIVDAEGYAPAYEDVFDGTGAVILGVRPKEELLRRVQCAEEGSGCVPPPNYLVQGTGPNNDLIITQNAEAIELV